MASADDQKLKFVFDLSLLILYSLTTIVALFGNFFVVKACLFRVKRSITFLLISNLAVSDILCALTVPAKWLFCGSPLMASIGDQACGLVSQIQVLAYFLSTFTVTVIAVDRFCIVHYPWKSRMRARVALPLIWSLSVLCELTVFFSIRVSIYFTDTRLVDCKLVYLFPSVNFFFSTELRKYRTVAIVVVQYFIPLLITSVLHALIIRKAIQNKILANITIERSTRPNSKSKLIKMLLIANCSFFACWLPFRTTQLVYYLFTSFQALDCRMSEYYKFFYWLGISSSCYNPFIYSWFNTDFRDAAKSLLFIRSSRKLVTISS